MTGNTTIQKELLELSPKLAATINNNNVLTVPADYFDSLPVVTLANCIQLEVKPEVPENYFEHLPAEMLTKIKELEQPATVPVGYFEGLTSTVLAAIKLGNVHDEMQTLSPVIAAIGNKNVLTVPKGYFNNAIDEVLLQIKPEAKIVPLNTKKWAPIRYMLAAAIVGILGFAIFNLITNNPGISNQQVVMAQAEKMIKSDNLDQYFNELSATDIEGYLTEKGQDVEAALVASTINNDDLPAVEDYLLDEATLEEYLVEKNISN